MKKEDDLLTTTSKVDNRQWEDDIYTLNSQGNKIDNHDNSSCSKQWQQEFVDI